MSPFGDGGLDLPFEGQDITDLTDDFAMSGGVVVMAGVLPVDGRPEPCVIFRFARPDGTFMHPILLVATDEQIAGLIPLFTKAAQAAITEARKTR